MSVISGIVNADASRSAASEQSDASDRAAAVTLQMFEEGRADTAPWRKAGETALNSLIAKVNAGPGDYTKSPGYDFRVDEGTKAIENSAAAKGGLLSGAANKALLRYGQDYATGDYQNFLANYYNSLTPLQSLAQVGQTTASQNAVQGNQAASNIAASTIAGGNANAAGSINLANSLTGSLNSGVNNYLLWKKYGNAANIAAGATEAEQIAAIGGM